MASLDHYHLTAATQLKQGAALVAYDTIAEGLRQFPGDPRLRQLMALALARTGASREANRRLQALVDEGHGGEEAVGMLARTYKDLWARAATPDEQRRHLESAFRWYLEAHRQSGGYWTAINAATMALLLGDHEQSRAIARKVHDQCLALHQQGDRGDGYWLLATLGEAALLLRDMPAAERWYREAIAPGTHGVGDLVSTRRNARLILKYLEVDPTPIESCFLIPRVAVFSGHLIDRPDRPAPRFPAALEGAVRDALLDRMRAHNLGFGYASAGNGGDILFLEGLTELGAELHVVLPYNREQFLEDSVDFPAGSDWAGRYRAVLEHAAQVITASEQRMRGGAMSFEYGFLMLDGTAAVRAEELDTDLVCFAVWDGEPGDGPGGTASSIAHWRKAQRTIEIIDLREIQRQHGVVTVSTELALGGENPDDPESVAQAYEAQVLGLLFADVAGFSKLTEEQIPRFVDHYLGRVSDVLSASPDQPMLINTWGDGLYLVFRNVGETGRFALHLSEKLRQVDWTEHGLPATLSLRIAVHAGPVFACVDPVTARPNFLGAHVALTARIEPVTPPGEVFGSGAFAALAKAQQVADFDCTYVGQTPLAKGYGTYPMYLLRERN